MKQAYYLFNLDEDKYHDFTDQFKVAEDKFIPCEYNLIHNIVYGAIEFAEDYGFSPSKEWDVIQYLFEEDDDRIPLIDIEFGEKGKPHYFADPNDTILFRNKVVKTLEKTAGKGNFLYTLPYETKGHIEENEDWDDEDMEDEDWEMEDEDWEMDDEDWEMDDEDWEMDDEDWDEDWDEEDEDWDGGDFGIEDDWDDFSPETMEKILNNEIEPNAYQELFVASLNYCQRHDFLPEDIPVYDIGSDHFSIIGEADMDAFPDPEENAKVLLELFTIEDPLLRIKKLKNLIKKQKRDYPTLYEILYSNQREANAEDAEKTAKEILEKFPDYLSFRIMLAFYYVMDERVDEAWELLGKNSKIYKSFPDREGVFYEVELHSYIATLSAYYAAKKDFQQALSLGSAMIDLGPHPIVPFTEEALSFVAFQLFKASEE